MIGGDTVRCTILCRTQQNQNQNQAGRLRLRATAQHNFWATQDLVQSLASIPNRRTLTSSGISEMNVLTIFLLSLTFLAVPATTQSIASSATTAFHENDVKYQAITPGIISTVAGSGVLSTEGVAATSAQLFYPAGIVVDKDGSFYIANSRENKIRKVVAGTGIITTVAGTGVVGYTGDGGQATLATLSKPLGLGSDSSGNIFIADNENNAIRKVTMSTGVITTVAGNGGISETADFVLATSTSVKAPTDVTVDSNGNIFIADFGNRRIRKVTALTGIITTICGPGGGSGVPVLPKTVATEYHVHSPTGVTLDTEGNVYIAGSKDPCIFKITTSTGFISVVAGTGPFKVGKEGYNGDDVQATAAQLNLPTKVVFDPAGDMYITDSGNRRIRKVTTTTGIITTVAGSDSLGTEPKGGDGGSPLLAKLGEPYGIALDTLGNIFFTDGGLGVVKKITDNTAKPSTPGTLAPSSSVASTPTVSSSASKAPAATAAPSASKPSTPTAPTAPTASSTGSQSSSSTRTAAALNLTMLLLTSLLAFQLCRYA